MRSINATPLSWPHVPHQTVSDPLWVLRPVTADGLSLAGRQWWPNRPSLAAGVEPSSSQFCTRANTSFFLRPLQPPHHHHHHHNQIPDNLHEPEATVRITPCVLHRRDTLRVHGEYCRRDPWNSPGVLSKNRIIEYMSVWSR